MDSVLQLTPKQRSELFIAAAQQSGIDVVVLEKDFWVCWTLKELFRLPTMGEHLIFKGGTSLSKVFKIINRFSEDIDVSIDRGFLGYGGANEPEAGTSNKEKQRRVEGLMAACQQKIADELMPALRGAIQGKIPRADNWSLFPDESDPDIPRHIAQLKKRLDAKTKADLKSLIPKTPVWMHQLLQQIVEK